MASNSCWSYNLAYLPHSPVIHFTTFRLVAPNPAVGAIGQMCRLNMSNKHALLIKGLQVYFQMHLQGWMKEEDPPDEDWDADKDDAHEHMPLVIKLLIIVVPLLRLPSLRHLFLHPARDLLIGWWWIAAMDKMNVQWMYINLSFSF